MRAATKRRLCPAGAHRNPALDRIYGQVPDVVWLDVPIAQRCRCRCEVRQSR